MHRKFCVRYVTNLDLGPTLRIPPPEIEFIHLDSPSSFRLCGSVVRSAIARSLLRGGNVMTLLIKMLALVAGTVLAASAFAQSAKEVRGPTPYFPVENEPAPKLIVDPALPGPLALGVAQIQYRVENVRIVPAFEEAALKLSPRVGQHITVDDLPWLWADSSDLGTVDMAG